MALTPGTRLGPYQILSGLGIGGMGEVFRARDTRLNRDVAIKVLPDSFANDAERLARFTREAQTLASLNHPNIAHIHGLEESNGVRALVMELVEGEDLSQHIVRGPIPIDEALPIARQIAEALEAAHEQGIIHRDLKPANIKLRPDGTVKVLDFGLAKLVQPQAATSHADLTASPTITSPAMMTGMGVILGTAAYMSPEQAKGREADKRSDIWAFGCVLYEMLTGQQPFAGDDVSDTLANVLKREPDFSVLPAGVPPAIRALVQRCLAKDRRKRIADIGVAQFLLTEPAGLDDGDCGTSSGSAGTHPQASPRDGDGGTPDRDRRRYGGVDPQAGGHSALTSGPIHRSTTGRAAVLERSRARSWRSRLTVAQLVYVANLQLYRRSIGELEAQPILGTNLLAIYPVFSPDGGSIAFYAGSDGTLKQIPVSGGTPATIARAGPPFGMSWGEDGIVFGGGPDGILRVSPKGGAPEQLVSVDADQLAHGPQILPGGKSVLFTLATGTDAGRWDAAQIVVQSLTSRERKTIINGGSDGRYVPSGHLIYAVSGSLFAVRVRPVDPDGWRCARVRPCGCRALGAD